MGIIAVLIAILFPVFARAREHANRVKCAANLRTIGQALTMYTQRYGHYPSGFINRTSSESYPLWPVRLREFIGTEGPFYCPSQDERCVWEKRFGGPGPVADAFLASYGYEPDENLLLKGSPAPHPTGTYFSYGYNIWGAGGSSKGLGFSIVASNEETLRQSRELPASRVRFPARMIAVTDSTADGRWDFASIPKHSDPNVWPGKVHAGGANVLFCDGHVEWHPQSYLNVEGDANRFNGDRVRMWNYDGSAGVRP